MKDRKIQNKYTAPIAMKHLILIIALLVLGIAPASAKTTYHCGYQGVKHMVIKKYVKDGNNIKDVGSVFDYEILDDNESGLVFASGYINNIDSYGVIIFINKKNMSFTRYTVSLDGEKFEMTGQCRRE